MSILFKCECGALWKADEAYAGQEFTCQTCGRNMAIPQVSDEDCVMVYKSGLPGDGIVMTLETLQAQIMDRTFGRNDLILYNGAWMPIGSVFESLPEPLPPPEPQGEDLAVLFTDLEPIAGFTPLSERWKVPKHTPAFVRKFKRFVAKTYQSKAVRIGALSVAGLLLLFLLFYWGALLSNVIRWKPVYLTVFNSNTFPVSARLGNKRLIIPPQGKETFQDIMLPWSRTKQIRLINTTSQQECYTQSIRLAPGTDYVLNPGGKAPITLCRFDKEGELAIPQQTIDGVFHSIEKHVAPVAIAEVEKHLKESMDKVVLRPLHDEIFTSKEYDLSRLGIQRSEKYQKKSAGKPATATAGEPLPVPVTAPEITLTINGTPCVYVLDQKQFKALSLSASKHNSVTPFSDSLFKEKHLALAKGKLSNPLTLTYKDGLPHLSGHMSKAELTLNNVKYRGKWTYSASRNANGAWRWGWTFHGNSIPKTKTEKAKPLTLVFDSPFSGKKTLKP